MSHYIALEGIEGTGKSSVQRALADWLMGNGEGVVTVREPGGGPTGEAIRQILLHDDLDVDPWAEALLFAAQRAQLASEVIRPALARGDWVVGDRSVYSSLAYQAVGRGLGDGVRMVNEVGLQGTWPDLVVLLTVSPEIGLRRQAVADRIGAEGVEFQRRVSEAFASLAESEQDRFVVIDTERPFDDVVADVTAAVKARL
jgi:dTMP kinase